VSADFVARWPFTAGEGEAHDQWRAPLRRCGTAPI